MNTRLEKSLRPNSRFARLAQRLRSPRDVQRFLRELPYNRERRGETLHSAWGTYQRGRAHCLEAALLAAAILEHHGYPPWVMSFESVDDLDHVIFIFQDEIGRWGSVARSRDEGLHGRPPRFRSLQELTKSYHHPYVDKTGRITGFGATHLDHSRTPWRASPKMVWEVERFLIRLSHRPCPMPERAYQMALEHYQTRGALERSPLPRLHPWW